MATIATLRFSTHDGFEPEVVPVGLAEGLVSIGVDLDDDGVITITVTDQA